MEGEQAPWARGGRGGARAGNQPRCLGVAHGVTGPLDLRQQQPVGQLARLGAGQGHGLTGQHQQVGQPPGGLPALPGEALHHSGEDLGPQGTHDGEQLFEAGQLPVGPGQGLPLVASVMTLEELGAFASADRRQPGLERCAPLLGEGGAAEVEGPGQPGHGQHARHGQEVEIGAEQGEEGAPGGGLAVEHAPAREAGHQGLLHGEGAGPAINGDAVQGATPGPCGAGQGEGAVGRAARETATAAAGSTRWIHACARARASWGWPLASVASTARGSRAPGSRVPSSSSTRYTARAS